MRMQGLRVLVGLKRSLMSRKAYREAPDSLEAQLAWVVKHWGRFVGDELRAMLQIALGIIQEEQMARGVGAAWTSTGSYLRPPR